MKKLITTDLGGHPIKFMDFEFTQEQIRELTKVVFGHLANDNVIILNGASASVSGDGYTIDIDEGWGYYNGEYYYIPEHQATGSSPNVAKWRANERWDARGSKKFRDIVSNIDVYKIRELKVGFYESASEGVLFSTTYFYNDMSWRTLTLINSWGITEYPGRALRYKKTKDGVLLLEGLISSTNYSDNIAVLPVGYRPIHDIYIDVFGFTLDYGVYFKGVLRILTTGYISFLSAFTYSGALPNDIALVMNNSIIID